MFRNYYSEIEVDEHNNTKLIKLPKNFVTNVFMKFQSAYLFSFVFLMIFAGSGYHLTGQTENSVTVSKEVVLNDFDTILKHFNLTGSLLIFDHQLNTMYSNDFFCCREGHLPASTFKIVNSIIALETGIINDEKSIIEWDGHKKRLPVWEKDLTFREAFQLSCVPCFQEIARHIGVERMRAYLDTLNYPGMVFDRNSIDSFWLEGESKISQMQQIEFLKRLYFSELPISIRTHEIMMILMTTESTNEYTLYGKTGWGIRDGKNNGWYVGFVESGDKVYFFATNVNPMENFPMDEFPAVRLKATKEALKLLNLIPE